LSPSFEKSFSQSSKQCFYFFDKIDGIEYGDWIVAYNGNVVVGSRAWMGSFTDVPTMGYSGSLVETVGYMQEGDTPVFKVHRSSGEVVDLNLVAPKWENNKIFTVSGSLNYTEAPIESELIAAYPNPFNPSTSITYTVSSETGVSILVFDVNGRIVDRLIEAKNHSNGSFEVSWDAEGFTSGVYFIKMITENSIKTQKVMLIK
jgi:hypothetical protein